MLDCLQTPDGSLERAGKLSCSSDSAAKLSSDVFLLLIEAQVLLNVSIGMSAFSLLQE